MTDIPDQEKELQTQSFSLCCVGGRIYLVGGGDNVRKYNPFINEWGNWDKLTKPRDDPCVCALNDDIIVMDGDRDDVISCEIINTNECMEIVSLDPMDESYHSFFGIVSVENKIYAVADDSIVKIMKVCDMYEGMIFAFQLRKRF